MQAQGSYFAAKESPRRARMMTDMELATPAELLSEVEHIDLESAITSQHASPMRDEVQYENVTVLVQFERGTNFVRFLTDIPRTSNFEYLEASIRRLLCTNPYVLALGVPLPDEPISLFYHNSYQPLLDSRTLVNGQDVVVVTVNGLLPQEPPQLVRPAQIVLPQRYHDPAFELAHRAAMKTSAINKRKFETMTTEPGPTFTKGRKNAAVSTEARIAEHLNCVRTRNAFGSREEASSGNLMTMIQYVVMPNFAEKYPKIWLATRNARIMRTEWLKLNRDALEEASIQLNMSVVDPRAGLRTNVDWEKFAELCKQHDITFKPLSESTLRLLDELGEQKQRRSASSAIAAFGQNL